MHVQNGTTISTSAEAVIPMDNPPICSGAIPQMPVFPGMSKSVGVEPTVALQLNPKAMYRKPAFLFDPSELTIDFLCSREVLLRAEVGKLQTSQEKTYLNCP